MQAAKEMAHTLFFSSHAHTTTALQFGGAAPAVLTLPSAPASVHISASQAAQTLSRLTVQCDGEEVALAEGALLVFVHRDRLYITVKSLRGEDREEECGEVVHCACVTVQVLLAGIFAEGKSPKGAEVSQVRAVTLAIYSKAGSGEDGSEASVLVGLDVGPGPCEGVFVCRLPLEDVDFTKLSESALNEAALLSVAAQALPEEFKSRKLNLKNVASVSATGERGVALVADASGKIVVLDVEGEEESEGDGSSDDEGEEEGGDAGDNSNDSMDQSC